MSRITLETIAALLLAGTVLIAAEPTTKPRSMPDVSKMDAVALRKTVTEMAFRLDAMEDQIKDLKQQLATEQSNLNPVASQGAAPATQSASNSWVITITSVVAQTTSSIEEELIAAQIRLTGGQSGRSESSAAFSQSNYSRTVTRNSPTAGGPNVQQEVRASGNSANIGPGSSAAYHDDSLETQLSRERDRLHQMESDWTTRKDPNGNQVRVNRFNNDEVARQRLVVSHLESERNRTQQRITALRRDLEKARSTTVVTGVTEDGQAVTATASQVVSNLARTLPNGQKVRIEGVATRKSPSLEIIARAIVPLN